jgi:HlyD family secretion protein
MLSVRFQGDYCMQYDRYFVGLGVVLLAALTAGCSSVAEQTSEDKTKTHKVVAVKAVAAERTTLRRTTTQPATVHAYYSAEIYARVSGYVRLASVDIGDRVNKGDLLAVIDVPEMKKQLLITDARVVRYEAQEIRAASGKRLAEANLQNAKAGIAEAESRILSAEAMLQAAEAEFRRIESLVQRQTVQQKLLDEARQRRDSNRANVKSAKAAVTMAESQVTVAKAAISAAEAEVQAAKAETQVAEAEREELQVMLDYAELRAPFDGVVTHRGIDPGDLVRTASEARSSVNPHFIITQIDRLRIRTTVPEAVSPLVDIGDAVSIDLTSARLPKIEGLVTRTSGSLDPSTRTMIVEIEVPNADGKLLPGMYGEATVVLVEKSDAVMLPASAVRFSETGQSFVYTIGEGGAVGVVDVTLGYDTGKHLEIASTLSVGQRVIDAHLKRFASGDLVRVVD